MPATILALDQIRDSILREIRNGRSEAHVGPDSDYFVRASSVASAVEGLYAHQSWIARQIFPDTADEENLILHARLRGIERKPAVAASGTALATGKPGVQVASGLGATFRDGTAYVTTGGGVFDQHGQLVVDVLALEAGIGGNRQKDDVLSLTIAPLDVNPTLKIIDVRGGTLIESLDSLLTRLLHRIRRPPAGGTKHDYWQWAMDVPGVAAAYVYPLRRGLGTVDVVITTENGLPSDEVIIAAQAHIDDQRPVRAKDTRVIAPTIVPYDVVAKIRVQGSHTDSSETTQGRLQAARVAIEQSLKTFDAAIEPGATIYRNRIGGLINDTREVVDYVIERPNENVVPIVDKNTVQWCRLGEIKIELMI
ncbi:baseplate J/gp47 family protein [Caballeronia sp. LZ001]|uniref:baseplate J/gp47 family protein n=1 Tax=Caballeronia sp. LZ001 TaxID=3038553 RepID=UPI00285E54B8|nr:baseplate J/gp47 family protein [Caballeronia sp. LZ001]MDR5803395.1 baseplate J/gp47 family protein [Caballeronia sp. LZ001]